MGTSEMTVYWIGANDRDTDSGWQWSDGTPFAFFYWQGGNLYVKSMFRAVYSWGGGVCRVA